MQVKSNQQYLLEDVDFASRYNQVNDTYENTEKGHGRIEFRKTNTFNINIKDWEPMVLGATVVRTNTIKKYGKYIESTNKSYYIVNTKFSAFDMQTIIRNHWGIESTHHNIRDTVLFEDANKIRVKPENMMIIRSFGYNLIQSNLTRKNFTAQMETNKLNFDSVFTFKGVKYV